MQEFEREEMMIDYTEKIMPKGETLLYIGIGRHPEHTFIKQLIQKYPKITVLEIFSNYIEPAKTYFMQNGMRCPEFVEGDIRNCNQIFKSRKFDLSVWSHGPEHIGKDEFASVLSKLSEITNKQIYMCCPYGNYPQGSVCGNVHENHVSTWYPKDFESFGCRAATFGTMDLKDNGIGSIIADMLIRR